MQKPRKPIASLELLCVLGIGVRCCVGLAADPSPQFNFTRDRVLYQIGYSHLDTQYRWAYPQVIREFLPNTVRSNVMLFEKYPHYIFNWTGANRYRMMQEYHPEDFETVRHWVAEGRWFAAGSSWEENDVLVPSSESIIRQILFGHDFFKREFGIESCEYMVPDCFGFPATLPSVLSHCGLRGFSTAKLAWGSAVGIPFNVGLWEGLDGQSVIAAFNPGKYDAPITENPGLSPKWKERLDADGAKGGLFVDFGYYGVGDRGGAPGESSVAWIEKAVACTGNVHVISARADEMFRDITDAQKSRLPKYKGDLLLTQHSAGTITSQAYMKRWNHENELLADAAERASVAAYLLGGAPYPREKLHRAWELVLGGQFHDILPGTALPKAFEYSWNDEIIAMNCFAEVLRDAVGAVAQGMDTKTEGTPLVVYNPLSISREDVVEAEMEFPKTASDLQVFDGNGQPVATQVLARSGDKIRFLFLAHAPPVGFAVFSARDGSAVTIKSASQTELKVSTRSLENESYRVLLDEAGDIASVYDKSVGREMLAGPSRLAFLTQAPTNYPAWNMDWKDQIAPPRAYVAGLARFRVVETGPVRVAIEVTRQAENSIFVQTVRLAAGQAGDRVEIVNDVDWQSKECSLKAVFPLAVSNSLATYNWDLARIERGNNDPRKYEVPTHDWFDLTDASGDYGVSVLCPAKYGSDKPADNLLRLTLLYTPSTAATPRRNQEQRWQDWGRHEFVYGLYGHAGDWRKGKSGWQAARLAQPLLAFRTAPHEGKLGRSFSLLRTDSDQVAISAVKLAEHSDDVVVRVRETDGEVLKSVKLFSSAGAAEAMEVNGLEEPLKPLQTSGGALGLDFAPWQLRSLALKLTPRASLIRPVSVPLTLPYNVRAFSPRGARTKDGFDDAGCAMPAEMIGDIVSLESVNFAIGPHQKGEPTAVACQGQKIVLPNGNFNRLYLLAAAVGGDTDGAFIVDNEPPARIRIQDWTGYIGQWDNRIFRGPVAETTYSVTSQLEGIATGFIKRDPLAWFCSHRHNADGSDAIYSYSYLFKYFLKLKPGARTFTLPSNPRIRIVAASVAQDPNDEIQPVHPLYDDFTGRAPVRLREQGTLTTKE